MAADTSLPVYYRKRYLVGLLADVKDANAHAQQVVGCRVQIISDFNGQSCGGRSKKSLRGRTFEIESVWIEPNQITLCLKDPRGPMYGLYCGPEDVKFV